MHRKASEYATAALGAFSEANEDLVVVGHSIAGLTIPLIAAVRPVRQLIFLSAMLPRPGKTQDEVLSAEPDMVLPGPEGGAYQEPAGTTRRRVHAILPAGFLTATDRLSPSAGFSHQDQFIFGAVLSGVEQHQVTAPGAFDPDGRGQIIIAILAEGGIVTGGGRPAGEQEHRKAVYAERRRRAAHGASPQAEMLKRLRDFGDETLTPSHVLLYLHSTRAEARRRCQGRCGITPGST